LRNRVTVEYSLDSRIEWLLSRYEALLAAQRGHAQNLLRKVPALSAPSEGLVHAEIIAVVRQLRRQLETAQSEIAGLKGPDSVIAAWNRLCLAIMTRATRRSGPHSPH
jgi:hypothetical protein